MAIAMPPTTSAIVNRCCFIARGLK
jgi:hypothetical protein